jgi:hypothetical protein
MNGFVIEVLCGSRARTTNAMVDLSESNAYDLGPAQSGSLRFHPPPRAL